MMSHLLLAWKGSKSHNASLEGQSHRQCWLLVPLMPPCHLLAFSRAYSFSTSSATMASVVVIKDATDAASPNAERTTFVGSMMPASIMLTYSPLCALKPC